MIFTSLSFSEVVFEFTSEEVVEIENYISELEVKDSLNISIIDNLEHQVSNCNDIINNNEILESEQDSLIILLENQIDSYKELVKAVEPKWYDKFKWALYGIGPGILIGMIIE